MCPEAQLQPGSFKRAAAAFSPALGGGDAPKPSTERPVPKGRNRQPALSNPAERRLPPKLFKILFSPLRSQLVRRRSHLCATQRVSANSPKSGAPSGARPPEAPCSRAARLGQEQAVLLRGVLFRGCGRAWNVALTPLCWPGRGGSLEMSQHEGVQSAECQRPPAWVRMASTRPRLTGLPISQARPELPARLPTRLPACPPACQGRACRSAHSSPEETDPCRGGMCEVIRHLAPLMPLSAGCPGCGSEPVGPRPNTSTERGGRT